MTERQTNTLLRVPVSKRAFGRAAALGTVLFSAVIFPALMFPASASASPLYKIYDSRGVVTFTTRKPRAGLRYEVLPAKSPRFSTIYRGGGRGAWRFYPVRSSYDGLIYNTSRFYGLEPSLVKAVVHVESAFKPKARSHKGAMGLMQLMPATARRFGVQNAYHPNQNVEGGVKYLKWLAQRYRGNVEKMLAAYNAGENAVDKYGGIPPYSETINYVKRVSTARGHYRCLDSGVQSCG